MDRTSVLRAMLESLNKQQRVAVEFDHTQALQVIAGPGTGKTKVLTSRVAYLLLQKQINPQDIIVTTFTNKAAKEMLDRLVKLLSGTTVRVSDLMIGTFHSVCLKILSRFGHKIGLRKDWRIIDEKEVDNIIENMIEKMPDQIRDSAHAITRKINLCLLKKGTDQWIVHPKLIKREISRLKAFAILPEEYKLDSQHDPALAYFYERFQGELNKINALDFDDLLMHTFRLLTKERCLPYIQHVFVDEFQDTNGIQMDLMFLLARGNHHLSRGITVVGDPDQSIYAFRHALANNFDEMMNKCALQSSRVVLVENYRSSQKILNTSETLIKQQLRGRSDRSPLKAQFDCDFPPVYSTFPASFLEGPSLIRELLYLKALPKLFTYDDFAILVRQRRQMKSIEKALIEHQIPYKIIRGHGFWELKEAVSMINLLKCMHSNNEINAIIASLQYPARGLGHTSAERIRAVLESESCEALQTLKKIGNKTIKIDMPGKARAVINEFIAMIDCCHKLCEGPLTTALDEIFEKLYSMSGMRYEYLFMDGKKKSEVSPNAEPDFSNQRHKNISVLKNYFLGSEGSGDTEQKEANLPDSTARSSTVDHPQKASIQAVRSHIRNFFLSLTMYTSEAAVSDSKHQESDLRVKKGFVTISTIHGAKGLEWPVVFIPGCEEGILPSIFGEEKGEESDDEDANEGMDCEEKKIAVESPRKARIISAEDTLNEERRMFFVAQTRAKHLLYLSAVDSSEDRRSNGPSRFLTSEVLHTMVDEQKVFENMHTLKKIYALLNQVPPPETETFSYSQLIDDYCQFIEKRRERLIWRGSFVNNTYQFDITQNSNNASINEFTTAAFQLQRDSIIISPQKGGNSLNKKVSTNGAKATSKYHNSNTSIAGSPQKSRSFAPDYTARKMSTSLANRIFAPRQNLSFGGEASENNTNLSSPKRCLHTGTKVKRAEEVLSYSSISDPFNCEKNDVKKEGDPTDFKPKPRNRPRSSRKLLAAPIDIATPDDELSSSIKREYFRPTSSGGSENSYLETTASEILHDPEEMTIDNRPIISNAKTLADAVKKRVKREEPTIQSTQSLSELNKSSVKNKVKSETGGSDLDIFSQLSRAKKKAKFNDAEIIVID